MQHQTTFYPAASNAADTEAYRRHLSLSDEECAKILNTGHPGITASLYQADMPDPVQRAAGEDQT